MSDIGSGTFQQDVDKIIDGALKAWEKYGFKDMDLWKTFQEDFKGFTEEDIRSANNHNARRLRNYLQKHGVWIRKQQKYTIARSLHELLVKEEPTPWTEAEIIACKENEEFASYKISRLIDSDFDKKPQRCRALTTTSPTVPPAPPAATSPTPGPSAPTPANTPAYPTRPSGTGPTPGAYMQPSRPTSAAYTTSVTGLTSAAYMQPPGIGSTTAAYTQEADIRHTPASHTQLSTRPAYPAFYHPPSASHPPAATVITSIGHGRELSNLVKIYTDDVKCNGHNDSFTFKLAIFHNICFRAHVLPEVKMKAFPMMLKGPALDNCPSNIGISGTIMNSDQVRYSIRKKWIKWNTQDKMEETKIGVG